MSRYVVDAGVAIKWVLKEDLDTYALRLTTGDHTLIAPDFMYAECGNVLWKRVRSGSLAAQEARKSFQLLCAAPLEITSTKSLADEALSIAMSTDRAVYDCIYLTLAIHEEAPFVTADEKLINALKSGPFGRHLLWVGDIPE